MPTIATKSAAASVDLTAPGPIGGTTPAAVTATALTATGNAVLGDAATDTLNVGAGGLVKSAAGRVGINLGTVTPAAILHIMADASQTPLLFLGEQAPYGASYGILWKLNSSTGANSFYGMSNSVLGATPLLTLHRSTDSVIIGSASSDGVNKLQVNGSATFAGPISLPSYTTATRPTYGAGKVIFDTTLGKMCVGGAAAWEVVTSS